MSDNNVTLSFFQEQAHQTAKSKGFWSNGAMLVTPWEDDPSTPTLFRESQLLVNEKLCLIHSEVSEALDAVRKGTKEEFAAELADILIRTLDLGAALGIDLTAATLEKMAFNETRPFKHGKRF